MWHQRRNVSFICEISKTWRVDVKFVWDLIHSYEWIQSHTNFTSEYQRSSFYGRFTGMNHGAYWWVIAYMNGSRHTRTSHITSHTNETHHYESHHNTVYPHFTAFIYIWVMARINESWHIWMSHVTHKWVYHIEAPAIIILTTNAYMSHGTYEWVMAHRNESCHTRMSHVTWKYRQSSFYDTSKIPHLSIALYACVCACVCVYMYEYKYM